VDERREAEGHEEMVGALGSALGQLRSLERRGRLAPELRPMATALGRATAEALRSDDEAALAEVLAEAEALVWLAESGPAIEPTEPEPGGAAEATAAPPDDDTAPPDETSPRAVALGRLRKLKAEGR